MFTILLHSSKTMRPIGTERVPYQRPALLDEATELAGYLRSVSVSELQTFMQLSKAKAEQTHTLLQKWSTDESSQRPAIDAFVGDIYSGLQVQSFTQDDRDYANDHLLILSGLYGGLRALDSICPYRLEMGYKLPDPRYRNLYSFWQSKIVRLIPTGNIVVNLSAVEYTKAVLPHINNRVITPKFLTLSAKTREPAFVTVHAKIARGAFAHWLIQHRITDVAALAEFDELGYRYDPKLSSPEEPVFICDEFKGLGLSVRLTPANP